VPEAESGKVPSLKDFDEYHRNITTRVPWWKDDVAPHISLRSRMWDGFEIYVGLDEDLRNMPNHTDGMILIGDAAGLESTELCDGVPAAWFSAEIAADVAIEAIRAGDTSTSFLKRYDERIRAIRSSSGRYPAPTGTTSVTRNATTTRRDSRHSYTRLGTGRLHPHEYPARRGDAWSNQ